MTHEPTQNKIDRAKTLADRNKKEKAFKDDKETQAQRDQLIMPVDDVSLKLVQEREMNEDDRSGRSYKKLDDRNRIDE